MKSKGQRDVCGSVSEFVLAQDAKAPGCASHERERNFIDNPEMTDTLG